MKSLTDINHITFVIFLVICFSCCCWCYGETEEVDGALMEKTEKEALFSAIQGFVGNSWNGSDLYPDPCGWTPIQGVSCDIFDGLWYVTALNIGPIHDNSLVCASNVEFRSQLFDLQHLQTLSFFNCFISARKHAVSIPATNWEKLAGSLESLEFRSNPGLIGEIPTSFTSLTKLRSLILLDNGLEGELPTQIGNLISLKRVVLAGNRFGGQIPESVGGFRELLILDLSRNEFSGFLPKTIGGLASLLKLDLSNNLLEGNLPNEIGNLKSLTLLDLSSNKLSGGLSLSIQEMNVLEEMVLSNNPNVGGDLKSIEWSKLQNLAILDLSKMGLRGEIPESISYIKKLRFLGLSENNLTGNLSPKLATLPCVSAMYVNGNNLTGQLKFSVWFYGKMGRRFGVWDNPNLCYPTGVSTARNPPPFGVKPCQEQELKEPITQTRLQDWNLDKKNLHFVASVGFSRLETDGFWWVFFVEALMILCVL